MLTMIKRFQQTMLKFDAEDSQISVYITVVKETMVLIMFTRDTKTNLLTKFKRVLQVMLVTKSDFSIQKQCNAKVQISSENKAVMHVQ